MALQLSPKIQDRFTDTDTEGDYPDADAMLEQALELLTERERSNHLRSLVAKGAEQARRGELIPCDEQFREEAKRSALRRFAEGESRAPMSVRSHCSSGRFQSPTPTRRSANAVRYSLPFARA